MSDELIFIAVCLLRLGIPLLIPRFPLPAIVAALVIDAADQTIFQNNTDLNLDGYQGYDKALDVYYLTIAYVSTIRNWADPFAFRVGQPPHSLHPYLFEADLPVWTSLANDGTTHPRPLRAPS